MGLAPLFQFIRGPSNLSNTFHEIAPRRNAHPVRFVRRHLARTAEGIDWPRPSPCIDSGQTSARRLYSIRNSHATLSSRADLGRRSRMSVWQLEPDAWSRRGINPLSDGKCSGLPQAS